MVEALNEMNALTDEIKAERDSYKSSTNVYKTSLEKEREDHRKQEKELMEGNAQHREMMEMMQNKLLVVAQTLQERELQHVKELDELRKAHAERDSYKEALNAMNALTDEIKAERDSYKSSTNLYKTSLEKEREDHRKQEKELMESNAQHREMMEMMQNNLLVVAQTLQERELQHV